MQLFRRQVQAGGLAKDHVMNRYARCNLFCPQGNGKKRLRFSGDPRPPTPTHTTPTRFLWLFFCLLHLWEFYSAVLQGRKVRSERKSTFFNYVPLPAAVRVFIFTLIEKLLLKKNFLFFSLLCHFSPFVGSHDVIASWLIVFQKAGHACRILCSCVREFVCVCVRLC